MISRKIHQIWFGDKPPLRIMETWKNYCKKFNWEYFLWTLNDVENLNLKNKIIFNFYKTNHEAPVPYALRAMSDIARLEIVNRYGGYYFDCDFYSWCNDIEKIISLDHDMCIFTPENLYPKNCTQIDKPIRWNQFLGDFDSSHFICNGAFYANPNNNILTDVIDNLQEVYESNKTIMWENHGISIVNASWYTCGCWQLTHFSKKYPFLLLPQKYIFSSIEYALENKKYDFHRNIICSYIHDHDEKRIVEYD